MELISSTYHGKEERRKGHFSVEMSPFLPLWLEEIRY